MSKIKKQILENTNTLATLYQKITQAVKAKATKPELWQAACNNFWDQYNKLAFPGGLQEGLAALKNNEPAAIEAAIEFLTIDPYYHRSGYNKKAILHLLKNVPLIKIKFKLYNLF